MKKLVLLGWLGVLSASLLIASPPAAPEDPEVPVWDRKEIRLNSATGYVFLVIAL